MATNTISLRGALVCLTAALLCSYQFMLQGAPSVMVPQLMSSFDLDTSGIGWLTSVLLCFYLLFQIPGGYLADRCNARTLLVACSLLMAGACYWFSVSQSFWSASVSRAAMGVIASPVIVLCMTLASRWFPERYFPTMVGMVEAFALVGGGIGPLFIPDLMAHYGWQGAMQVVAVVGVLLAVLMAIFVRSKPEGSVPVGAEVEVAARPGDRATLMVCCLYGFGMFAMIASFGGLWGIPFFYERFPGEQEAVANMVAFIFVGAAIGAPFLGWLASLLQSKKTVMIACAITAPIFFSLLIFCSCSMQTLAVISFLAGVCSGGYMLAFSVVKKISNPARVGVYLAIANGCMLMAGPVMQPFIGFILESLAPSGLGELTTHDYQWAFAPLLLCQLLALVGALRLRDC